MSSTGRPRRARDKRPRIDPPADVPFGDAPRVREIAVAASESAATLTDVAAATMPTGPRFGAPAGETEDANRRALNEPGGAVLLDAEEIVRRQLALLSPDATQAGRRVADDVPQRQFVLRGLSQSVPNPQFEALRERRERLEHQAEYLRRQREEYDRLFYRFGMPGPHLAVVAEEDLERRRALFLDGFQPPQALSLLVPTAAIPNINRQWRTRLGAVLTALDARYATANTADNPVGGTRKYRAELLAFHVRPIIERRLGVLRHASFEDMPLPREVLRGYFVNYLDTATDRIVAPPQPTTNADEMQSDRGDAASSLGHAFRAANQDEAVMLTYYAGALAQHANREYRAWFREWRGKFTEPLEPRTERAVDEMRSFVERLVRTADNRARLAPSRYVRSPGALNWSDYTTEYERLVFNEIAEHRARTLHRADEVRAAFETYLTSLDAEPGFPRTLLLNLPADTLTYLDEALETARASIAPDDAAGLAEIATRRRVIEATLAEVWPDSPPDRPRAVQRRAPNEPAAAEDGAHFWSPYDLSHPLDEERTAAALPGIVAEINLGIARFDTEAEHRAATEQRTALDALYANKRLTTELSQVTFLLRQVLSETIEQPLELTRLVYDTDDIELAVRLELAPEVAARIAYVPLEQRRNADTAASDALTKLANSTFRVSWYHRPLAGGGEQLVAEAPLAPVGQTARLRLFDNRRQSPEAVLAVAGVYRAEVREIVDGAPVGDTYVSLFSATVRVLARCVRDNVLYTPTLNLDAPARHRECAWRPPPADAKHATALEALRLLTTYGVGAYTEYRLRVALNSVPNRARTLPPWGSSAPANLEALVQSGEPAVRSLFSFGTIVGAFLTRFGHAYRDAFRMSPALDDLALLLRSAAMIPASAARWRASGAQSAALDDVPSTVDIGLAMQKIAQSGESADLASPIVGGSLDSAPLARLLAALQSPRADVAQSGRERRYFAKLVRDFDAFRDAYRAAVAAAERIPSRRYETGGRVTVDFGAYFERKLAVELDSMSIGDVASAMREYGIGLPSTLFRDTDSEEEFQQLVRSIRPYERQQAAGVPTTDAADEWFGTHSFATEQPTLVAVARTENKLPAPNANLPSAVFIARRGSEPTARGYDYAGLHAALVAAVQAYNAAAAARSGTVRAAYERVGRLVTMYNYFAFLAPPLAAGTLMRADAIEARAADFTGVEFYPTPLPLLKDVD